MGRFTEEDIKKATDLMNFISDKAEFTLTQKEIIEHFQRLAWFQQQLIPKMEAHILEVKYITRAKAEAAEEPKKAKKSKAKNK